MTRTAYASIAGLLLSLACAASGCGSGRKLDANHPPTVREGSAGKRGPTAPGASVRFANPKPGSTTNPTVRVTVKLTKFKLAANAVGGAPKAGRGHLRFAMDEGRYDRPRWSSTASSPLALKLGAAGKFSPSTTPTITYRRLPRGEHRLVVYLVNNDDTNTDISATSIFRVK
jgi:hypothetical protein